jgi:PAS domain S-box-containing protein
METLPASLVRLDRDWTIAYVNASAETVYGRTRDELVGRDVWDAFPEARGTVIEQSYCRAVRDR